MKELEQETQLQVMGGSVYLISTFCIVASIALYRILRLGKLNMAKIAGRRRY